MKAGLLSGCVSEMSYPPRPPMGMPPMGGMGYGYSPMGMMPPMGMGMMPPGGMMRPSVSTQPAQPKKQVQKLIPQEIPKDSEEKPPVTTVFVGNITERAPDQMMRTMLQRCGNVLSWKRVQGASGKLQAFGFCEYEDPEATLRCIRLLNEWPIADKKLVAKVDAKTKTLLDEYKEKKAKKLGKAGEDENINNDELQQREDRVAKAGLDAIMREYQRELSKPVKSEAKKGTKSHSSDDKDEKAKDKEKEKKKTSDPIKDVGLDDMVLEEDQKALINREINRFRDAHKGEEVKEIEIDGIDKDENRIRRMQRELERERQKMKAYAEEALKRERERAEMKRAQPPKSRSRSRSRSRERIRERPGERSRESREREREWRERERLREKEDEEEAYERKRLERKLREKEAAYQERLKNWEQRERKKTRDYEKDKEKEQEKKEDENREARRLKEFLEDYDDERDDPKYYKGSALTRRLKEREKEMEADARDRAREKEEIEEIRQKLTEEGHPDVELKMAEIEKERDEHLQPRLHEQGVEEDEEEEDEVVEEEQDDTSNEQTESYVSASHVEPLQHAPEEDAQVQIVEGPAPRQDSPSTDGDNDDDEPPPRRHELSSDSEDSHQESSPSEHYIGPATQQETETRKTVFTAVKNGPQDSPNTESQNTAKRKKMTVGEVFNQDEEDMDKSKKRKLVPLDYSDEEKAAIGPMKKAATAEEKRKLIKNLIERIPTAKDDLFAFPLDWTMVDSHLMDKRIKPWVNKKIVEYIGEEEPTLTEFICQKVILHSTPQVILNDVAMVLDEEAEVFVVKMWRLLIYETEAKKLGLVK